MTGGAFARMCFDRAARHGYMIGIKDGQIA